MTGRDRIFPFNSVGIVGLGLMGGSLARSLKVLPNPPRILGMSQDSEEARQALATGAVDEMAEGPEEFFRELGLVVYCTPLSATLDLLGLHQPSLDPGTLITDVVSLKAPLLDRARSLGLGSVYVGCHPMAGGEKTGFDASEAGVFLEAKVWVVEGDAPPAASRSVQAFWAALGAIPETTDAQGHDSLMSWVSHLPQLTSTALAQALGSTHLSREELGPGGMGMTRLAASSPEMWIDILGHAPASLSESLKSLEESLIRIRTLIEEGRTAELETLMKQTQDWSKGKPWR